MRRVMRKWHFQSRKIILRSNRRKKNHLKLKYQYLIKTIRTVTKTNSKDGFLMTAITTDQSL